MRDRATYFSEPFYVIFGVRLAPVRLSGMKRKIPKAQSTVAMPMVIKDTPNEFGRNQPANNWRRLALDRGAIAP
jgi:hypothetical protein